MRMLPVMSAATALALAAAPAAALRVEDRYWMQVMAFKPSINTTARFNKPSFPLGGTNIDFESDLGMKHNEWLPDVEVGIRLGKRWRLEGEFYELSRTSNVTLARDIVWDDTVYPAGADVDSKFETTLWRGGVGYSFIKRPTIDVGASVGLHSTNFYASIEGQGDINGVVVPIAREVRDQWVPLPTIGGYATWNISPIFSANARVDWLSLTVGDYSGGVTDIWGALNARVTRHIGLGAGWRYTNYHVDVNKTDWNGYLRYKYSGPAFFLTLAF